MATTYRKLSEIIINTLAGGIPNDDFNISTRHVAELIAMEVAFFARKNAFENSNAGETTFSNDQFISVFNGISLQTDSDTGNKYITLPQTPAGLPNNQEISQVSFVGCPNAFVIPIKSKNTFAQGFLPKPRGFFFYKIEDGKIVFDDLPAIITGNVNVKMIGAVEGTSLLDSPLNVPKDVESEIFDKVVIKLAPERAVRRDVINDSVPI